MSQAVPPREHMAALVTFGPAMRCWTLDHLTAKARRRPRAVSLGIHRALFCRIPLPRMMRLVRNGFLLLLTLVSLGGGLLAIYSRGTPTYIALASDIRGSFNGQPVILGKAYAGLYAGDGGIGFMHHSEVIDDPENAATGDPMPPRGMHLIWDHSANPASTLQGGATILRRHLQRLGRERVQPGRRVVGRIAKQPRLADRCLDISFRSAGSDSSFRCNPASSLSPLSRRWAVPELSIRPARST